MTYVAVVGPGEATAAEVATAREVGRLLAERRCVVVCGGLGGVMAAVADGTRSAGGTCVGLLPGATREGANESLTVAIPTGLGQGRNALVVRSADGVIAVGGSWGTLSEVALARRAGVPVVSIGGWVVGDQAGQPLGLITADTAAEAVTSLLDLIGGG
ncbi:MAG: TIGR00725 family protein [Mycobacteriales bacterium]